MSFGGNLLEYFEEQDQATKALKRELDHFISKRDEHLQLIVNLQRKGHFMEADDTSVSVNPISDMGRSATPALRGLIENSLTLENRLLRIEIEALNLQLSDTYQDTKSLTDLRRSQNSIETNLIKSHDVDNDESPEAKIESILFEVRQLTRQFERAKRQRDQAKEAAMEEKENAKRLGKEFLKILGGNEQQIDVDHLLTESCRLWQLWDLEYQELKDENISRSKFWRRSPENKVVHVSDVSRLLKIINQEKWMGSDGTEGLQKMALALLETIDSKADLVRSMTKSNKILGARLHSLARSVPEDSDDKEEQEDDKIKIHETKEEAQENQNSETDTQGGNTEPLSFPRLDLGPTFPSPEIEFEQPARQLSNEENLILFSNQLQLTGNKRC